MQTASPIPLLTTLILTELATPDSQAMLGEWDAPTRALLSVAIPEMATELLLRRACDDAGHPTPLNLRHQITAAQSLSRARQIVRAAPPLHPGELALACRTILQHSQNASERNAASDVLSQIQGVAA